MDISASRWQYNSSQGSFQIPNAKSMMSFMNYAVTGEGGGGEGEVLCWASNEVGGNYTNSLFHLHCNRYDMLISAGG